MKKGCFSAGAILAFATIMAAQAPTEPAKAAPQTEAPTAPAAAAPANALAPGTLLSVELSKGLDAKKSKAEDPIEARTAVDILAHGRIVVPRNTKIIGHVTEAKPRSKTSPDSMIGITFDRVRLKDGSEVVLPVVVQAIARPLQYASGTEAEGSPRLGMPQTLPSQRTPLGDDAPSGVPSSYPGDLAVPPDPMGRRTTSQSSTVVPLSPTSHGVVGMKDLSLDSSGPVSVLSSNTVNVHLDGGTQLILRVQ